MSVLGVKFLSLMASVYLIHPFVETEEQLDHCAGMGVRVKGCGEGAWRSTMQITPVAVYSDSLWACTDFAHASGGGSYEPVMYIGPDTLALVNTNTHDVWLNLHASRDTHTTHTHTHTHTQIHEQHILDLCAGSGIQGIASLYVATRTHTHAHTHTHSARRRRRRRRRAGRWRWRRGWRRRRCVCVLECVCVCV